MAIDPDVVKMARYWFDKYDIESFNHNNAPLMQDEIISAAVTQYKMARIVISKRIEELEESL